MRGLSRLALVALVAVSACSSGGQQASTPEKIGFVFIGDKNDLGYNQAIWEGSEALARAFPDVQVLRIPNVPETAAATDAMESLVRQGVKIIFATSFGYRDAAYAVARRHPDVIVMHQGGLEPEPQLNNFGTYFGKVYEPVYEAGIVAGAATRTGKLGFVAAFPIPDVLDNINAFLLGARTVRPTATLRIEFTGSWCTPAAQLAAAKRLLATGVDVLTQHQDCTRTVLEAAERAHVFSVGYHEDGSAVAPHGYLVGAVWSWGDLLISIVRTIRHGNFVGSPYNHDFRGGLATGDNPFVLSEFSKLVSLDAQRRVDAANSRFVAGQSPFTGPITDRHGTLRIPAGQTPTATQIEQIDYLVEGVLGPVPGSSA